MYQLLLVDDEDLIRQEVSENVQWAKYGYELVGSCENGADALTFIKENPADVVLTDICMPYMDGMELSKQLSEVHPRVKIIILSGYDDFHYAQKAIRYGVRQYLLKPITADEIGEILTELKTELDEERASQDRLTRLQVASHQGQMLRDSEMIYHLITGFKTEAENRPELMKAGIDLTASVYQTAIMELDFAAGTGGGGNEAKNPSPSRCEADKKENALMAFVLYNISQEIIKGYGMGEACQGKDRRTLFLFFSRRPLEFKRKVKEICREIMEQVSRITGLAVTVGIGGRQSRLDDISQSYEEAAAAFSYQYLGEHRIWVWDEIREEQKAAAVEPLLAPVLLAVKANHHREIAAELQVLAAALRKCRYDRRRAGSVLQQVVDGVEEIRKRSEMDETAKEWHKEAVLRRILDAGDLPEAIHLLTDYCVEIGQQLDNHKNIGGRKYAVLAMDYITQNYGDCDLTLNAVCSYLNISPSWFSSIFKTVTGTTFLEALNGIRMQKARELLTHTDMKNYQIAERVGFNDPHYFSIAFKKTAGMSPTEYAREVKK